MRFFTSSSSIALNSIALKSIMLTAVLSVIIFSAMSNNVQAAESEADADILKQGKTIAFDRRKGNCLACHMIGDGDLPGNQGPPLLAMQQRFPNKADLRAQIWDATVKNPQSLMPPFGKHGIITEQELDKIVEYIYSL